MTPAVVHSILEPTPEGTMRRIVAAPEACGLIEIRADRLRADDVRGLVRRAGRPVAVTVRSTHDGGGFDGSVEEKRALLAAGLDAGAAFVDVEWNGPLRDWADGPASGRTILSDHGARCDAPGLARLFHAMASSKAARLKIVPHASRVAEAGVVRELLSLARGARRPLAAFALGRAGLASRVFALAWGSWGTYGAAERGFETAEGQPTSRELLDVYRVLRLSDDTRRFALVGSPVSGSPSPALHAAGYREAAIDAVYLPLDTEDLDDVHAVAGPEGLLRLEGFGVTMPLKEAAAARCASLDPYAACGSVNTVISGRAWEGFNTDAPAALALIGARMEPSGADVAIVGAGGTARAIGAALVRAGATVTFYNRSRARGRAAARAAGAEALPLEALPKASWSLLVQATPLGRDGEDVLPARSLTGRMVLDAVYGPHPTPLTVAARARGLAVADGLELLVAQAALQFERLTGRSVDTRVFRAAAAPWGMAPGA